MHFFAWLLLAIGHTANTAVQIAVSPAGQWLAGIALGTVLLVFVRRLSSVTEVAR